MNNQVIYQIYPKSFCDSNHDGIGDLQGIISKLDYLQDLGIDYLWLSPINQSPQNDNGYDISDYDSIDPMFGTMEDYQQLINEANKRGIKIMMDLVLNHTSTHHEWFKKALSGDPYYQAFYYIKKDPVPIDSIFGGMAWQYEEAFDGYYFCFFDKTQADLNWDNPNVRAALYEMINRYIKMGVQGFRLDVINHISKDLDHGINANGPKYLDYLKELNHNTFTNQLLTVGECWFASVEQMKAMCQQDGLTQAFHFEDVMVTSTNKGKWYQQPLNLNELAKIIEKWQNEQDLIPANVMDNHDLPRLVSLWLDDDRHRKASASLLMTVFGLLRGNFYLFQGDEIGMTNAYFDDITQYRDVETLNALPVLSKETSMQQAMTQIKRISRDNARVPFAWDNTIYGGFSQTKPWIDLASNHHEVNLETDLQSDFSLHQYTKKIIAFKKEHEMILNEAITAHVLSHILELKRENVVIVANFSNRKQHYKHKKHVYFSNLDTSTDALEPYQVIVFKP